MKHLTVILLILLAGAVSAGQLVVSSLPYTVNQSSHSASTWDTITISGGALSSTTSGITFAASTHHWILLGPGGYRGAGGHTITFGTDWDVRGSTGISIGYRAHDITIQGMRIIAAPTAHLARGSDPAWVPADTNRGNLTAINAGMESYNITFKKSYGVTTGYGGWNGSYGMVANIVRTVWVDSSELGNDCYAYVNRSWFIAAALTSQRNTTFPPTVTYPYTIKVTNSYMWSNAHAAVYLRPNGSGGYNSADTLIAHFDNDTVVVDSRNNRYTSYAGAELGAANAYGISSTYLGPGSYFNNVTILSGSTYLGGRGIMFVATRAGAANPVEVSDCRIDIHAGSDVEFPDSAFANGGTDNNYVCGIKIRQGANGIYVHDNSVTLTGDTTAAYGRHGIAWHRRGECIQYEQLFDIGDPYAGPYNVRVENNLCSAKVRTNVESNRYDLAAAGVECANFLDASFIWRGNRMLSQSKYIYFYGVYDGPARYWTIDRDTVGWLSSAITRRGVFNLGSYLPVTYNYGKDISFLSGTTPTACYYWDDAIAGTRTYQVTLQQTVKVKVIDLNGNPLSGATVSIQNAYGQSWSLGTTSPSGVLSRATTYQYFSQAGDSSGFNPHTLTITRTNLLGQVETQTKQITISSTTDTVYIPMSQVDNVVANRDFGAASTWGTLGIPREQVAWYKGDTLVFISNGSNRVNSWGNGTINAFTNGTVWNYDHNHMELRNDTLWVFGRRMATYGGNPTYIPPSGAVGSDTCWVNLWRVSGATPTLLASGKIGTGAGWPSSRYDINFIATGAHIGSGSNMVAILRYAGNSSMNGNVAWYSSTDNGLTWTYGGQIAAPMVQNVQVRFDIDKIFNGSAWGVLANQIWVSVFSYGSNPQRFYSATYNGSAWTSVLTLTDPQTYSAVPTTPCWQRCISTQTDTLGWYHVTWTDNASPSHILHAYRKPGASTWYQDTVETMGWQMPGAEAYTAFSFNEKHNRLHIFYTRRLSATANNNALATKQWSNTAEMWGPRQQIGAATGVIAMAGSQPFPKTIDSCRSAILYTNGTRALLLSLIDTTAGTSGSAPPHVDTILTVSDATGSESPTDSLTFDIEISPVLADNLTYSYATQDVTAFDCSTPPLSAGTLYRSTSGTQTILAGDSTAQIKVAMCQDYFVTGVRTMRLWLSSFNHPGIRNNSFTDSMGTGTINNVDTAGATGANKRVRARKP